MSRVLITLTVFSCLLFMSFSMLTNNGANDVTPKEEKVKIQWMSFEEAVKKKPGATPKTLC